MTQPSSLQLLEAIKSALQLPTRNRLWPMKSWAESVVSNGWVNLREIADAMESQDPRLYSISQHMEEACSVFEIPVRYTASRPRHHRSESILFQSLSAMDAGAFMVRLRNLGFEVDPTELNGQLISRLMTQNRLSDSELDVFCHDKNATRCRVILSTGRPFFPDKTERFITDSGYRIKWMATENQASLEVRGPRYRPPKPLVEHVCQYCGLTYYKGDHDAVMIHQQQHRRYQNCVDPKPLRALGQRLAKGRFLDVVTNTSPKWMHEEVYERAVMFKREMKYDFIQWESPPKSGRPQENGVGYLMIDDEAPSTVAGACAFRQRSGVWTMDWAWLAPKYRRKGVMQRYWGRLVQAFGDFPLAYPLSEAMQSFVLKHGTQPQKQRLLTDRQGESHLS